MTTQKRIQRKAVSLFAQVNGWKSSKRAEHDFYMRHPTIQSRSGWLSLAKKVVRLENRVRIMRVKEFKK